MLSFAADCTTFLSTCFIYVTKLEIDSKRDQVEKQAGDQIATIYNKDKILTVFATLCPQNANIDNSII